MAKGRVKWFSEEKGYGFISSEGGGEDIFVHYTDIEGIGLRARQGSKGAQSSTRSSQD
jgi:cold shock protein